MLYWHRHNFERHFSICGIMFRYCIILVWSRIFVAWYCIAASLGHEISRGKPLRSRSVPACPKLFSPHHRGKPFRRHDRRLKKKNKDSLRTSSGKAVKLRRFARSSSLDEEACFLASVFSKAAHFPRIEYQIDRNSVLIPCISRKNVCRYYVLCSLTWAER